MLKLREKKNSACVLFFYTILIIIIVLSSCNGDDTYEEPDVDYYEEGIEEPNDIFRIEYISVGDGDCTLLYYDNKVSIIDTGFIGCGEEIVKRLNQLGITEIEYIFLSHMHSNRIGGAPYIIENMTITKGIVGSSNNINTDTYYNLVDIINKKGYTLTEADRGQEYKLGTIGNFTIINPSKNEEYLYDTVNRHSIVGILTFENIKFMFCGDADTFILDRLANNETIDLKASVILVPHQGSKLSLSEKFIDAVNPRYAMISYGYSAFKYKSVEVVDLLHSKGVKIGDLFENKSYSIRYTGDSFEIEPFDYYIVSNIDRVSNIESINTEINPRWVEVYAVNGSYKYHIKDCKTLSSSIRISLEQASEELEPCDLCNPPILGNNGKIYINRDDEVGVSEILGVCGDVVYGAPGIDDGIYGMIYSDNDVPGEVEERLSGADSDNTTEEVETDILGSTEE